MRPPIFVRSPSDTEKEQLQNALRSSESFVMRRAQIVLASHRGESASQIARSLGCGSQTVRDAIHDFNRRGLDALVAGSSRPKRLHRAFDEEQSEALREILHQDPTNFGKEDSFWTLEYAAEVSFEQGITERRVSGETIRATLARLGVRWQRAKRWMESPDPEYERKKGIEIGRSDSPRPIRSGLRASRTRAGFLASRGRACAPGPRRATPRASSRKSRERTIPTLKRSPATGCICPDSKRPG